MVRIIIRNMFYVIRMLIVIKSNCYNYAESFSFEVKPFVISHAVADVSYPERCKAHHSSDLSEVTV
jgi:hypothetical protein